mmetsp:Transcript_16717/g.31498  ORF Transcript_16717/g.31498 Transcript_16717/m.31498 type:complete len:222 (+) Transcript_16717:288-953(+)
MFLLEPLVPFLLGLADRRVRRRLRSSKHPVPHGLALTSALSQWKKKFLSPLLSVTAKILVTFFLLATFAAIYKSNDQTVLLLLLFVVFYVDVGATIDEPYDQTVRTRRTYRIVVVEFRCCILRCARHDMGIITETLDPTYYRSGRRFLLHKVARVRRRRRRRRYFQQPFPRIIIFLPRRLCHPPRAAQFAHSASTTRRKIVRRHHAPLLIIIRIHEQSTSI